MHFRLIIIDPPGNMSVIFYDDVILCLLEENGNPPATYLEIYLDSTLVSNSSKYYLTDMDCLESENPTYTCVTSNHAGNASAHLQYATPCRYRTTQAIDKYCNS